MVVSLIFYSDKTWFFPSLCLCHDYSLEVFRRDSSSVQSLSHIWLFVTPWTVALQASLSIINSWSLLKLMSIESVMPSNHLILCRRSLPSSISSFFSCLQSFPVSASFPVSQHFRIMWPKYQSFSFSSSPSNEYSRLVSFRIDWFDQSLCCAPETITPLLIGYTPIQNKKFKKK